MGKTNNLEPYLQCRKVRDMTREEVNEKTLISEDEKEDFEKLKSSLEAMANAYNTLKLWEKEVQAAEAWEKQSK